MPALGMAMTEGRLVAWLKRPGESVKTGESVAEIETDKSSVELQSPADGRMGDQLFEPGSIVPTGMVIAHLIEDGEPAVRKEKRGRAPRAIAAPTVTAPHKRDVTLFDGGQSETLETISLEGLPLDQIVEWLEAMVIIREFEEAADPLALQGKIPGGIHSAAGQEAVAVGSVRALAPTDILTSSHRSHHHSLAKGLTLESVMAELYGKSTGILGGRGGHMHLADFSIGFYGSNGIVGGGLGIAMGASLAALMQGRAQVAIGFFGDGGANTGRVWEIVNLASVWRLPLIVVCENNLYAVETHVDRVTAAESIASRAGEFGLPSQQVDGQDVGAMFRATKLARERAIKGEGPTFIEALTYRYKGHNTGDSENYRERSEVERWRQTMDPILRLARTLEAEGLLGAGALEQMQHDARKQVEAAIRFAEESPWPDTAQAANGVTAIDGRVRTNL
jgi:TPP-dependent pyruvate/acetoin dehydrogenase alpha subunit